MMLVIVVFVPDRLVYRIGRLNLHSMMGWAPVDPKGQPYVVRYGEMVVDQRAPG